MRKVTEETKSEFEVEERTEEGTETALGKVGKMGPHNFPNAH